MRELNDTEKFTSQVLWRMVLSVLSQKNLVEKFICKHAMARKKLVIIIVSLTISNQL